MRLFACVVIAALASACFLSTEPVERLALSMTLGTTEMRGDSGIVVRLEARNLRPVPIRVPVPCAGSVLGFRLEGPEGAEDADLVADLVARVGCRREGPQSVLEIGPGEALVQESLLRPVPRIAGGRVIRWPEGTYQIVGVLRDEDGRAVKETEPQSFELVCTEPGATEC